MRTRTLLIHELNKIRKPSGDLPRHHNTHGNAPDRAGGAFRVSRSRSFSVPWATQGLNLRPLPCRGSALPSELDARAANR